MITVCFNPAGLTAYHLIKFSLMGETGNIRIADVIMHSHSTFIAEPTTDAHFLISSFSNLKNGKGVVQQLNYMRG